MPKVLVAAPELVNEGIDADVIDVRVLRPLDTDTSISSVLRTRRAVIVDEAWRGGSISAELSARITEHAFFELDAPVTRVCSAEVTMPYAKDLEDAALPDQRQGRARRTASRLGQPALRKAFALSRRGDSGTCIERTSPVLQRTLCPPGRRLDSEHSDNPAIPPMSVSDRARSRTFDPVARPATS